MACKRYLSCIFAINILTCSFFISVMIGKENTKLQSLLQPKLKQKHKKPISISTTQITIKTEKEKYKASKAIEFKTTLPILIIHIGPRKTASTYLQSLLRKSNGTDILGRDSFVYFDKKNACIIGYETCTTTPINTFIKLEELRVSNDTNVIISNENIPSSCIEYKCFYSLKRRLKGWNVRIVISYRRYYELLTSEYDQECRRKNEVNIAIRTFDKFYRNLEKKNKRFVPVDILYSRWKRHFNNVYVFNMYDSGSSDLFTKFICRAMPEANHTCHVLKNGIFSSDLSINSNQAKDKISVESLLITHYLGNKGKIYFSTKDSTKYFKYAKFIDKQLSSYYSNKEKPLACLSKTDLRNIFEKTNREEEKLLPTFYNYKSGSNVIKGLFEDAVKNKKFCQLDINGFLKVHEDDLLILLNNITNFV